MRPPENWLKDRTTSLQELEQAGVKVQKADGCWGIGQSQVKKPMKAHHSSASHLAAIQRGDIGPGRARTIYRKAKRKKNRKKRGRFAQEQRQQAESATGWIREEARAMRSTGTAFGTLCKIQTNTEKIVLGPSVLTILNKEDIQALDDYPPVKYNRRRAAQARLYSLALSVAFQSHKRRKAEQALTGISYSAFSTAES